MKRGICFKASSVALALLMCVSMAGCAGNTANGNADTVSDTSTGGGAHTETDVKLTMTVNLLEEDFEKMVMPILRDYQKEHPNVDVEFQVMGDESALATRVQGGGFQDICYIPKSMTNSELPNYFAPLGDAAAMGEKYYFGDMDSQEGITYGLTIGLAHEGILYNQDVIDKYLNGQFPKTLDDFYSAAKTLKENGVTPLCINAGSGWPLENWDRLAQAISENRDFKNELLNDTAPWEEGKPMYREARLLADFAANGWVEADTVTDQWEASKNYIPDQTAAFMIIGSWAVPEIRGVAETLGVSPENIRFAPIPYKNDVSTDNKLFVKAQYDWFAGVNKNSKFVEEAKDFLEFFVANFYQYRGFSSPLKGGENSPYVQEMAALDYVEIFDENLIDPAFKKKVSELQLDLFGSCTYLREYVLEPVLAGGEPNYEGLNKLWQSVQ